MAQTIRACSDRPLEPSRLEVVGMSKSARRSGLSAAVLSAACLLIVAAPSGASAGLPSVNVASLASAGGVVSSGAGVAGSDCANRATMSNFHAHLVDEEPVPLGDLPADAVSVPTWSGSFTTDGTAYPFTMVGTDPAAGSATTHVSVEIIPLRLDFPGSGCVLEDDNMAADLEASPLFTPTHLLTGTTQYVDDFQRANFWSTVSTVSPDYHLLLDPTVLPAATLQVPGSQGITFYSQTADQTFAIVGGKWFQQRLEGLLGSLNISPTTLAVFVPFNTLVTDETPDDCLPSCAYYDGYHAAVMSPAKGPHAINTFIMASYHNLGNELPPPFDYGAEILSHELLEWANDPFDHPAHLPRNQAGFESNLAPAWSSPFFGDNLQCSPFLEVADTLEFGPFLVPEFPSSSTDYLLADGAFLSWFARQSPSTAFDGLYDEGGLFTTYSTAC
jgi:hypothetical protein